MNRKFSPEKWAELVEQCKTSSISQRAFCKEKNISLTTFSYWVRKLKSPKIQEKDFFRITPPIMAKTKALSISVGDLFQLNIPSAYNKEELKQILLLLRECL